MRQVPTTWNETRFIDGYPGKYVVIARRHNDKWYIVGINAQKKALNLQLNLPMLLKGDNVIYYKDNEKMQPVKEAFVVENPESINIVIHPGGGVILVK